MQPQLLLPLQQDLSHAAVMVIITVTMVIIMVECLGISLEGKNLALTSNSQILNLDVDQKPFLSFMKIRQTVSKILTAEGPKNVFYPHPL